MPAAVAAPSLSALAELALRPVGLPGVPASATVPDLLRLVAVPAFAWAAYRDVRTRRVPNRLWAPLALLGVALLAWEALARLPPDAGDRLFALRVAISVGLVIPLAYAFWRLGGFGGADAKAFMTLAVLVPTAPTYFLPSAALPVVDAGLGVFALTVLSNTVLVGLAYPLAIAGRNLLAGEVSITMFLAVRVPVDRLPTTHGRLAESPDGFDRRGLDLDALRMYLRWRGADLGSLRDDPGAARDPASVDATYEPTDGAVDAVVAGGPATGARGSRGDAGRSTGNGGDPDASESAPAPTPDPDPDPDPDPNASDGSGPGGAAGAGAGAGPPVGADSRPAGGAVDDDPWAAAAFLSSLDHGAYGTDAATLREGLAVVTERDAVWVSPGIPFIVPTFVGLLVALTYGDLLVSGLRALGLT